MSHVLTVRRNHVYNETVRLETMECHKCGIVYGCPEDFLAKRLEDGGTWYCPNGDSTAYCKSTAQEQRERADKAEQLAARRLIAKQQTQDQLDASERSKRALKGVVTRTKRRVGKGVCPCCNRTFPALAAHMETKHPNYVDA